MDREHIVDYLEKTLKVRLRDTRIRAITVNPGSRYQPKMRIKVGRYCANLESSAPPQLVVGIFETDLFVVCTPERGAGRGLPHFLARPDVRYAEEERQCSAGNRQSAGTYARGSETPTPATAIQPHPRPFYLGRGVFNEAVCSRPQKRPAAAVRWVVQFVLL